VRAGVEGEVGDAGGGCVGAGDGEGVDAGANDGAGVDNEGGGAVNVDGFDWHAAVGCSGNHDCRDTGRSKC